MFFRALRQFTPMQLALLLALSLFLTQCAKAEGVQVLGDVPRCAYGEIHIRLTLDAPWADRPILEGEKCMAAALLERLLADAQLGGNRLICRVQVLKVEAPKKQVNAGD